MQTSMPTGLHTVQQSRSPESGPAVQNPTAVQNQDCQSGPGHRGGPPVSALSKKAGLPEVSGLPGETSGKSRSGKSLDFREEISGLLGGSLWTSERKSLDFREEVSGLRTRSLWIFGNVDPKQKDVDVDYKKSHLIYMNRLPDHIIRWLFCKNG